MEDVASYPAQRESEEPLRFLLSDCANAHERDLLIIWRALGHWHEPPGTVEDVLESIRLLRAERRQRGPTCTATCTTCSTSTPRCSGR